MRSLIPLLAILTTSCAFRIQLTEQDAVAGYTDAIARNKFLPLAAAAYSGVPGNCLANAFQNAKLKRQLNVKCDLFHSDTCSGYTALLNGDQAIVLSFRGTDAFLQLITESNESIFEAKIDWPAGGKVSKYFYNAFWSVWTGGMKDDFLALRNAYPTYKVWVAGHSLGGSMASLAASYIVSQKLADPNNVTLYTFGQPRTGDKNWASAHDNQQFTSYRVTHWRDMVPHVPPVGMESYAHHKTEVFYHSGMKSGSKFKICNADEDYTCSDGLTFTMSISDHLHYFEKDVSDFGARGCK
ncbi:unnamed protein product [Auanema sp. JU1783]|nr:unnamed protein product [Auanema sp. JU1783]